MTRSNPGDPTPEDGNPFDLGLPMVRMPARKSKRRRPGRRGARRRRPPPPVEDPDSLPEADGPSYQSGDWEQWLDPLPPPREGSVAVRRPDPEDRLADDDTGDDDPVSIPAVIDRSGGNPGPRMRHPRRRRVEGRVADKVVAALIMTDPPLGLPGSGAADPARGPEQGVSRCPGRRAAIR